jgi:butyryl-CoA dehydrogenase/short/branched chain acyl-CoA dehydrogenase
MHDYVAPASKAAPALTMLSEEEQMFRESVRAFAQDAIKPHVREMDEKAEFRHELIEEFFRLGLMSIAVPEEYGGAGGTFFQTILAI